jgi:hypothetical protein
MSRNYKHLQQITRAHTKSSQSAFTSRFLVTDLNNAVARWLMLLTTELIVPKHLGMGHVENIVLLLFAFVSVAAETCLLNHCPETGCVIPFIKNLLPYQRTKFCHRYPATGLQATAHTYTRKARFPAETERRELSNTKKIRDFTSVFGYFLQEYSGHAYVCLSVHPLYPSAASIDYKVISDSHIEIWMWHTS